MINNLNERMNKVLTILFHDHIKANSYPSPIQYEHISHCIWRDCRELLSPYKVSMLISILQGERLDLCRVRTMNVDITIKSRGGPVAWVCQQWLTLGSITLLLACKHMQHTLRMTTSRHIRMGLPSYMAHGHTRHSHKINRIIQILFTLHFDRSSRKAISQK